MCFQALQGRLQWPSFIVWDVEPRPGPRANILSGDHWDCTAGVDVLEIRFEQLPPPPPPPVEYVLVRLRLVTSRLPQPPKLC